MAPVQEGPRCVPASALYISPGLDVEATFAGAGGNHLVGVSIPDFWAMAGAKAHRLVPEVNNMQEALLRTHTPLHVIAMWDRYWTRFQWGYLPPPTMPSGLHAFVIYGWLPYYGKIVWRAATTLPGLTKFHYPDQYRPLLREVWEVTDVPHQDGEARSLRVL